MAGRRHYHGADLAAPPLHLTTPPLFTRRNTLELHHVSPYPFPNLLYQFAPILDDIHWRHDAVGRRHCHDADLAAAPPPLHLTSPTPSTRQKTFEPHPVSPHPLPYPLCQFAPILEANRRRYDAADRCHCHGADLSDREMSGVRRSSSWTSDGR